MATPTPFLYGLCTGDPYHISVTPLLDPVDSWQWPTVVLANFKRRLTRLNTVAEALRARSVETPNGCYWLLAYRSHNHLSCLPPYPGVAPSNANDMTIGGHGFMDGSLGRFDFRWYPQIYNPRRPWLGCARNISGFGPHYPEYEMPLQHWVEGTRTQCYRIGYFTMIHAD
jgi:hypothetical protein